DHQETTSEVCTPRPANGVDSLPGDDHCHYSRLARAGRQFQSEAQKLRVRVTIGIRDVFEKSLTRFSLVRCNLCQPNRRLDSLNLTEERAHIIKLVGPPMLEKTGGFGCHQPVVWTRQLPPLIHLVAKFIDDRG